MNYKTLSNYLLVLLIDLDLDPSFTTAFLVIKDRMLQVLFFAFLRGTLWVI